ncbi:hypothetical protein [Cellulomonas sp. HZM]|uniref:PH-like domain-containing protein n=1 Tax=Cellulomonas sp. HZM TaxID=1454010 RepID=UPI00049327BE|nr:hypothetical protein [Cellulomonas sp. HZM]
MTGGQAASVAGLVVLVALAWWGMWKGWQHRGRATQDAVRELPAVPVDLGPARLGPIEATYVSTTRSGDWLDRVVARDLGTRSPASVSVHDEGVLIARTGAHDVYVPAATVRGAALGPGIAGKVVGGEGLVVLTWQPDPQERRGIDTGLRPRHAHDRELLVQAVQGLTDRAVAQPGTTDDGEKEQ